MSNTSDTITAVATPPGRGGIGVLRISGPGCASIARAVLGRLPLPRQVRVADFRNTRGDVIDRGIALFFPAPHSYTGEDVLELQAHGGPVLMDMLLKSAIKAGARQARAGEFTERAFLNGQLDLSQAEAVADIIDAASERAVRAARRSLDGEFSKRVQAITNALIELRVQIEAGLDFAEEDPGVSAPSLIEKDLQALVEQLDLCRQAASCGRRLRDGFKVVIAGTPNVGKSSLLNRLCGNETAIVTSIPGTTRDPVSESIIMDGLVLELTDTAGLRESHDAVEKIGIERALEHSRKADLVLIVFDDPCGPGAQGLALGESLPSGTGCIMVQNKTDLNAGLQPQYPGAIGVSAKTGTGIGPLLEVIQHSAGNVAAEGEFSARQRHVAALDCAGDCIMKALMQYRPDHGLELLAEDLRQAQQALEEISGRFSSDDLLGRIFSSFCIGK